MKFLHLLFFMSMLNLTYAQTATVEKQIQIDDEDDLLEKKITSNEKYGFSMHSYRKQMVEGKRVNNLQFYSNELEKVDEKEFSLLANTQLVNVLSDESRVNYAYYSTNTGVFEVVNYDYLSKEFKELTENLPKAAALEATTILDGVCYYYFTSSKEDFVVIVNPSKQEINKKTIVFDIKEHIDKMVKKIQVNKQTKELYVLLDVAFSMKQGGTYLVILDANAEIKEISEYVLPNDRKIIDSNVLRIGDNKYMIVGSFDESIYYYNKGYYGKSYDYFMSDGLFSIILNNGAVEKSKEYFYLDIKDYFTYLPERFQQQIQSKISSKSNDVLVTEYFEFHDIIEIENDVLLIAEGYKPTKNSSDHFDGFQYNLSLFARFSKEGELVWTKTKGENFEYKPKNVERFVHAKIDQKAKINCYSTNDFKLLNYEIDKNGSIGKEESFDVLDSDLKLNLNERFMTSLNHWYDKYFISYTQHRSKGNDSDKKRKVITVSKLTY